MHLPTLMVAPNGARRTKADHREIPVTVRETVQVAKACFEVGADGLHAHVRDDEQKHILDAGRYRELLAEMAIQAPDMQVQITTEAVGYYSPRQQRQLVRDVMPAAVSISVKELCSENEDDENRDFYHWAKEAGIAVQHILYSADDLRQFGALANKGVLPKEQSLLLFVLGRYAKDQQSTPEDLSPFLHALIDTNLETEWAVCAFGNRETDCLIAAHKAGGKMRVGFENSLFNKDGSIAKDNVERVSEVTAEANISRKI